MLRPAARSSATRAREVGTMDAGMIRTRGQQFYDQVISGDASRAGEFVAPDAVDHGLPPGFESSGDAAKDLTLVVEMFQASFSDVRVEPRAIVVEGDTC